MLTQKRSPSPSNAGFTLIEMMIAFSIVGILSAIAAPSWITFTNRQRINAANDAVLRVLQEAQRQAKNKKLSYSASFKSIQNQVPKVIVHPASTIPTATDPRWTNLGEDIALKPGQVLLYSNIDEKNPNKKVVETTLAANQRTITFDYMGTLPPSAIPPLKVVVAEAKPGSLDPNGMKRCVIVETLIGGMRTAKNNDCNDPPMPPPF